MKKEYLYKQIMKSSSNAGTTFLYAGSDHLLLVDRTLLYEKYRKFFYADIQAFSIKKSPESTIFTCLLLLIFIPFLIFSFYEPTVFYISGFYGFLLCINFVMVVQGVY